jgi:hypothetical protein
MRLASAPAPALAPPEPGPTPSPPSPCPCPALRFLFFFFLAAPTPAASGLAVAGDEGDEGPDERVRSITAFGVASARAPLPAAAAPAPDRAAAMDWRIRSALDRGCAAWARAAAFELTGGVDVAFGVDDEAEARAGS